MQEKTLISNLQNRYSLQKTLQNSLIPIGKTAMYIEQNRILENDEQLNSDSQKIKKLMNNYHKIFIEDVLSKCILTHLNQYADLYYSAVNKKRTDELKKVSEDLRKEIADTFKKSKNFNKLFKKEIITELLWEYVTDEADKELLRNFTSFTTYFTNFFNNRKNMYTADEKSTAIAYRCINQNLPKFLDNIRVFDKAKELLSTEILETLNNDFEGLCGTTVYNAFTVDYFNFVLTQPGIDRYNAIIGGYTTSDRPKVKGINEYISKHNKDFPNDKKIPMLKPLYNQILSDKESVSFIPEKIKNDNEVLDSVYKFYNNNDADKRSPIKDVILELKKLFSNFEGYALGGIYIKNDVSITDLSNEMFGLWSLLRNLWNNTYDEQNLTSKVKNYEKYEEKRKKVYKSNTYFSLDELQKLINSAEDNEISSKSVSDYYCNKVADLAENIFSAYSAVENLLIKPYDNNKNLVDDKESIALIKNFLDSVKALEKCIKPLSEPQDIFDKDELFYGIFTPFFDNLSSIDSLYDMVRNYVTQKPYSTDKYKLNFDTSSFLNGWGQNFSSSSAHIFKNNNEYYLMIVDKKLLDEDIDEIFSEGHLIYYDIDFQKPDFKNFPRQFIRSKGSNYAPSVKKYNLPIEDIIDIYDLGKYKTEYRKENYEEYKTSLCKLIDYYKIGLSKHESYSDFVFKWKDSEKYNDISEFYNDCIYSCYRINYKKANYNKLIDLVDEGKIYLFQIYNKDFSQSSKGTKNLHTLYFEMLFDERNLENVVYKLNGRAEMFYRPASIKNVKATHPKNIPIENKNELSEKKYSTFAYDLIKNKRYTKPQFSLHIPITINFQAPNAFKINDDVRMLLQQTEKNCVIGIDRGERNLLYYSVINSDGVILEQGSLNIIKNEHKGITHMTDYHKLLDKKEKDRQNARQNWKSIENIKELKNGYISQAVHKICQLVVKYDAVIVMEDLNKGFKNSRVKFEKQVYQKFEKMLIDKLNYYVDKSFAPEEDGGLFHAYQLTNKFESFEKMGIQNGILFYIPPYLTSKIDPVTGFVNLLYPRYQSLESSYKFISNFDSIRYNENENYFEFEFDYSKFPKCTSDYRKKWTVCTYGDRIQVFRNSETGKTESRKIWLTEKFIDLFNKYSIEYRSNDLKELILKVNTKEFFEKFMRLLSLTLQMRNSCDEQDYLISPVKDKNGNFFDSRNYSVNSCLPPDADANGAYNIARKGLWAVEQIKKADDISKVKLSISNAEWLEYAQKGDMNE